MDIRLCRKCGAERPINEFYPDRKRGKYVTAYRRCAKCLAAYSNKYYHSHLEQSRKNAKNCYIRNKARWKIDGLARFYKLTPADYQAIMDSQGNKCAACGEGFGENRSLMPHVDHDHKCCKGAVSCGKCIRGIIHARCNLALGASGDSVLRLRLLADYLDKYKERSSSCRTRLSNLLMET